MLTGIISNTDIIGIDLLARTKVSELMKKKVYTAGEVTALIEIAGLMSRRQINRVPIVNREGKLTGIITRADMVRSIANSDDPFNHKSNHIERAGSDASMSGFAFSRFARFRLSATSSGIG